MDARTEGIEQDLDLDVAPAFDEALEDQPVVTECGRRLAPGAAERVGQAIRLAARPHALAPAPCRGLDEEREADLPRRGYECLVGLAVAVIARDDGDAEGGREPARGALVA